MSSLKFLNRLTNVILVSFGLLVLWGMIRVFWIDSFIIPSDSMLPTLQAGDKILVDKSLFGARIYRDFHFNKEGIDLNSFRTNGTRGIRRNDVIVFNVPVNEGQIKFVINYVYCKRCLALPGDTISIENGFYRNNNYQGVLGNINMQRKLSKMKASTFHPDVFNTPPFEKCLPHWTIKNYGPLCIPRKGDLIAITPREARLYQKILEWELKAKVRVDSTFKHVYAQGQELKRHRFLHDYYFLAGDHVMDSRDSRYWGLVPDDYIVGIVTRIEYSKNKNDGGWNGERFMKKVE